MPLADNDVESELSYAYLHAVAAQAGCECCHAGRHSDNLGIDARITASGEFTPEPSLTLFDVFVQLKATSQTLAQVKNRLSFRIEKSLYDKMRITSVKNQWLLIVLVLPHDSTRWLTCSAQTLSIRQCAYWVSLRGAPPPPAGPADRLTIYIPRQNRFTPTALQNLLSRLAQEDWVTYET